MAKRNPVRLPRRVMSRCLQCFWSIVGLGVCAVALPHVGLAAHTERISVDSIGRQGAASSFAAVLSAGSLFAAFDSSASNLVRRDVNAADDYFLLDRDTGTLERVSVGTDGTGANQLSEGGRGIGSAGRFLAFSSPASNLEASDTNGLFDVYLRDRLLAVTERVSIGTGGVQGNGDSFDSVVSGSGRFVAFTSSASNLVAADSNGRDDVFVRDRTAATTERVSVDSSGVEANGTSRLRDMTPDGRFVVFESVASNLVTADTNNSRDIYVRDRLTGVTDRVSVDSLGLEGNGNSVGGAISADGHYVVFESTASNLVPGDNNGASDVFVHDRQTGTTERVSVSSSGTEGNHETLPGWAISDDGRFAAFTSAASNLVPGDTNGAPDVFVRDRVSGTTSRVSVTTSGGQATGASFLGAMSSDGVAITFDSEAADLLPGDTNGVSDGFLRFGDDDGDGVPEWAGDCNDSNPAVVGGCACTSDSDCDDLNPCTVDSCVGGACHNTSMAVVPRTTKVMLRQPNAARRYETLTFQGEVVLSHPFSPPLDPAMNGIVLQMINARGQRITASLPGGVRWSVNTAGTRWRYDDAMGTIGGIFVVMVSDESARQPGRVRIHARGHGGDYVRGAPLMVRWRVGASESQCGEITFLQPDGPMPRCRENSVTGNAVLCGQRMTP